MLCATCCHRRNDTELIFCLVLPLVWGFFFNRKNVIFKTLDALGDRRTVWVRANEKDVTTYSYLNS